MTALEIPAELRTTDKFHRIAVGFLNRRLCMSALLPEARERFQEYQRTGSDHLTVLANQHLLVTTLLGCCEAVEAPTLLEALNLGETRHLFRTERLAPCPEAYDAERVSHAVELDLDYGMLVVIAYHTSHIVSKTGKMVQMVLARGAREGYVNSIVGLLHDCEDRFEIEPLVIGAPWFEHPRNGRDSGRLMFLGARFGEVFPEDIDQFAAMHNVRAASAAEWMDVMRRFGRRT